MQTWAGYGGVHGGLGGGGVEVQTGDREGGRRNKGGCINGGAERDGRQKGGGEKG